MKSCASLSSAASREERPAYFNSLPMTASMIFPIHASPAIPASRRARGTNQHRAQVLLSSNTTPRHLCAKRSADCRSVAEFQDTADSAT